VINSLVYVLLGVILLAVVRDKYFIAAVNMIKKKERGKDEDRA